MSTRLAALMATSALCLAAAACSPAKTPAAAAQSQVPAPALKAAGGVDIPGYAGDFDHFAFDEKGDRLFLAGEEGKTLEVFKLSTGQRLKTLTDVKVPHSLLYMPEHDELLLIDGGGKDTSKGLDGQTYAAKRTVK